VDAIGSFGERRLGDIQKVKPLAAMPATIAFRDVRGYRIGRPAKLRAQLESLE